MFKCDDVACVAGSIVGMRGKLTSDEAMQRRERGAAQCRFSYFLSCHYRQSHRGGG